MRQSSFSKKVLMKTPQLSKPYKCPFKPLSGHVLSLYSTQETVSYSLSFSRKEVIAKSTDSGLVALDIADCDLPNTAPIVLIVPGTAGDTSSLYVRKMCHLVLSEGSRPIVFIQRGLSGLPLKTARIHSAATCEDVYDGLDFIHELYPDSLVNVVGYSLGGSIVIRLSYMYSEKLIPLNVNAIGAISALWGISAIDMPLLYSRTIGDHFKGIVLKNKELFEEAMKEGKMELDFTKIEQAQTFQDIDRTCIVPIFGYNSKEQYYWDVEQWFRNLPCTKIPTYTINSFDDPICNDQAYSYLRVKAVSSFSPLFMSAYTQRGGHCTFNESFEQNSKSYADQNVISFFKATSEMNTSGELEVIRKEIEKKHPWFNQ
ncbi:Serine aminopeptidase S33 domain-containing protein [Entamoeba marina]